MVVNLRKGITDKQLEDLWFSRIYSNDLDLLDNVLEDYRTLMLLRYPPFLKSAEIMQKQFDKNPPRHPPLVFVEYPYIKFHQQWFIEQQIEEKNSRSRKNSEILIGFDTFTARSSTIISGAIHVVDNTARAISPGLSDGYINAIVDLTAGKEALENAVEKLRIKYLTNRKTSIRSRKAKQAEGKILFSENYSPLPSDIFIMNGRFAKLSLSEITRKLTEVAKKKQYSHHSFDRSTGDLTKAFNKRIYPLLDPRNLGSAWQKAIADKKNEKLRDEALFNDEYKYD